MQSIRNIWQGRKVAPYVGAWIETVRRELIFSLSKSHPMWVRGLKLLLWVIRLLLPGRTLCGCVD